MSLTAAFWSIPTLKHNTERVQGEGESSSRRQEFCIFVMWGKGEEKKLNMHDHTLLDMHAVSLLFLTFPLIIRLPFMRAAFFSFMRIDLNC